MLICRQVKSFSALSSRHTGSRLAHDEMWTDELWDLGAELENRSRWWILKPGMADRGMGIRLFHSKESLEKIFEEFEQDSDDDENEETGATTVVTYQLRHFIIQVGVKINW